MPKIAIVGDFKELATMYRQLADEAEAGKIAAAYGINITTDGRVLMRAFGDFVEDHVVEAMRAQAMARAYSN